MAAMLWSFWPASLGGRTDYVVTHGTSMEPAFHTGDLAILHKAAAYRVGDVAAYHSDTLKVVVLHRITAIDALGRFSFKGDNNGWVDPDHPGKDKLLGRLWFRVPQGSRYLDAVHSPWALGILATLVIGMGSTKTRGRRSRRAQRVRTRPVIPAARLSLVRRSAVVAGATAVVAGLAAGYLCELPATRTVTHAITVTHAPSLTYVGVASRGTTYPDGRVHTGQPVYLRLAHQVTLLFADRVTASAPAGPATTTAALTVTLSVPGGWSSVLKADPAVPVTSGPATVVVDIDAAMQRLRSVAKETGVGQAGATVTLQAHMATTTDAEGHAVDSLADTSYAFSLDATALRPPAAAANAVLAAGPATLPGTTTSDKVTTLSARAVNVAGRNLSLAVLRTLLGLLALALALVAAGLVPLLRSSGGELANAVSGFGWRVVEVESLDEDEPVVAVTTAAALQRLADRYERLVLYLPGTNTHVFAVHDDGVSYRLTIVAPGVARRHLRAAA
jgi:signal peptidase I